MMWLLIGVFGAIGALARYGVSGFIQRLWPTAFPVGTLIVNVTGAFAAGLLLGVASETDVPDLFLAAAGVGFLGSYSTFSTWMVESVLAAESGGRVGLRRAVENLTVPLIVGVAVVAIGFTIGQWPYR